MSNDMLECAARLRHLLRLNEPRHGGPYAGHAAEACMRAMEEAASILEYEDKNKRSAADVVEALRMVRDADDDCHRDGLQTIPPMPRSKIDRALAGYTRDRITPENTPERIFPAARGSLPMLLSDVGAALQGDQNVKPDATNGASSK